MMRGSTWSRWDLHIHSPASYEGEFGPPAEDATWKEYAEGLISAIKEHQVRVLSTQDYFTTKGYEELIDRGYYDPDDGVLRVGNDEVEVLIIPGMEIRFNAFVGEPAAALNAHLYFDPGYYSKDSVRSFLDRLVCFREAKQPISAHPDELTRYGHAKNRGNRVDPLLSLEKLNEEQKYSALHRAEKEASIEIGDLREALRKHKDYLGVSKGPVLVAIAGTGHGAVQEYGWNGRQGPVRKEVTRLANMVLSSNAKDRKFYLGQHPDAPPSDLQEAIGGLKPCIWGSDAHDIDTLLHPSAGDTKRYTWIKAEPTFEGFRQIQFEPGSRVVIQEEHPQQKSQYRTIESVQLNSGNYADCEVHFNRDLSVIIGGKSTGKSLLLYAVAATMNRNSAANRHPDGDETPEWYNGVLKQSEAAVRWDDGQEFTFDDDEATARAISYIPQSYINRLAEDPEELNNFVLDVLTERKSFRRRREKLREKVANQKDTVQSHVRTLEDLMEKERELKEELRGLGDKQGIESEIERLEEQRDDLTSRSGLSDDERSAFEQLKRKRKLFSEYTENQDISEGAIDELEEKVSALREEIANSITNAKGLVNKLSDAFVPGATGSNDALAQAFSNWLSANEDGAANVLQAAKQVRDTYKEKAEELDKQTERLDDELEPLEDKLELKEELERVEKSLQKEKDRLGRLEEVHNAINDIEEECNDKITDIAQAHAEMFALRKEEAEELRDFLASPASDSTDTESASPVTSMSEFESDHSLRVIVDPVTEGDSLAGRVKDMLDGRRSAHDSFKAITGPNAYDYTSLEEHVELIEDMLSTVVHADEMEALGFRDGYDASQVVASITDDWFDMQYSLSYDDESVTAMSPGKRGMVLLQFLLERSDAEYPILLDQPEDNLDNRTIFDHVVKALRHRKTERQIIVVTHNPNLVVATDAEQVIVAKQSTDHEMEEGADRFQYASGALESSRLSHELDTDIESVRDWVCEILEGGPKAFQQRQNRYNLSSIL